jgi:hypothetical protein
MQVARNISQDLINEQSRGDRKQGKEERRKKGREEIKRRGENLL